MQLFIVIRTLHIYKIVSIQLCKYNNLYLQNNAIIETINLTVISSYTPIHQ